MRRLWTVGSLALLLSGCVTMRPPHQGVGQERPSQNQEIDEGASTQESQLEEPRKPKKIRPVIRNSPRQKSNGAVNHLISKANKAQRDGDFATAESYLERAYRISHRDPRVSLAMAEVLFAQEKPSQSEQWALRSIGLLRNQQVIMLRKAWELVSQCRIEMGDYEGARTARLKAKSY
ncbi:MAG: hypothetical protein HRU19_10055 [Pseudobacteriovorax sp.]|nr:hypothetical protein [Pseudobacteriovorax sp.]